MTRDHVSDEPVVDCTESPDGEHYPDPLSAQQADGVDLTVDFYCVYCGASGAVRIEPSEIQW